MTDVYLTGIYAGFLTKRVPETQAHWHYSEHWLSKELDDCLFATEQMQSAKLWSYQAFLA